MIIKIIIIISNYSVGIYLGPNDCSITIYRDGKVEITPNDWGEWTIPSIVSFTKTNIHFTNIAKNNEIRNPKNTVYGIREIIGKKFDGPDVQKFIKKVLFKIEKDSKTGKPKIIV